jgi:hypothetical protein
MLETGSRARVTLVALVALPLALFSQELFRFHWAGISALAWRLFWIALCFAGVWLAHGTKPRAAWRELGLGAPAERALAIALVASLPLAAAYALTHRLGETFDGNLHMRVVLAPFTHALLFFGFTFRQLYRRAGWPFWAASFVLVTANVPGGLWRIHDAAGHSNWAGLAAEVGERSVILLVLAWLFVRAGDNVWLPMGMSAFVGAWPMVFTGPDFSALAYPAIVKSAGMVLAYALAALLVWRYYPRR